MKVLVIDDNQQIVRMLTTYLKLEGHDCVFTNNGEEGISFINNGKFDAILLDLAMPDVSGFDIINKMQNEGKLEHNKTIVLTATSLSEEKTAELISKGIHSCLTKPVDLDTLLSTISS
ncbi:MAG: response regulator [Nitrosopumilaceae archaeon]|nr:response regulator [Nitrosopumilaceae archaeon]